MNDTQKKEFLKAGFEQLKLEVLMHITEALPAIMAKASQHNISPEFFIAELNSHLEALKKESGISIDINLRGLPDKAEMN